jgi:hypothetical protein
MSRLFGTSPYHRRVCLRMFDMVIMSKTSGWLRGWLSPLAEGPRRNFLILERLQQQLRPSFRFVIRLTATLF